MTTRRLSVSQKAVSFFDGMEVTEAVMDDEQSRNINIDAANVANFMGSGVVEENIIPNVLLDTVNLNSQQQTLLDGYSWDGQNTYIGSPLNSVSDETEGVQLSVTVSGVDLDGAHYTKVCIIGDEFGDNLIHDDLVFNQNGTQITRGRYIKVRGILFNNFAMNMQGSKGYALDGYNLIGRCIIREAKSMEVSFDSIVASQTAQPNKYFDNFIPALHSDTIMTMLQDAIGPDKSVNDMDIGLYSLTKRELAPGDVTTRVGQKFKAEGTNIQKISVLLSVKPDTSVPPADAYDWSGSIILTINALQTEVSCPVSPTPDNMVDFDPDPAVLAQISLDATAMELQGVVLNDQPQVVDFVFTGNKIADPIRTPIILNNYYCFTVSRAGDAILGTIQIEEAPHRTIYGYMVVFDGTQWINVTDSDTWFSIEGDYIKVADGLAYEDGIGVEIPKLELNSSNVEAPYIMGLTPYYTTSRNAVNFVLLDETTEYSDPVQDQRTGNQVYSRKMPIPAVSLINKTNLATLLVSNPIPVLLADAIDENPRGNPTIIGGSTGLPGLTVGEEFNILSPDADIINNSLINSILTPDTARSYKYRIISAALVNDAYGDVNGDGIIDSYDVLMVSTWIADGYNYSLANPAHQQRIIDGFVTVEEILRADVNGDGVVDSTDEALIYNYVNKKINSFPVGSTFSRMNIIVESILDPLTTTADISGDNISFMTVPFVSLNWSITYFASWIPDLLIVGDMRREMPTTFTDSVTSVFGGQNNFYIPGNEILGGQMKNPDGTPYSVDFEFTQFTLDIPITDSYGNPTFLDGYVGILLFDNFVAEASGGKTTKEFDALKYSDGTYVQPADFSNNMVKLSPAIQSLASEYPVSFGGTIEDIVGTYYDSNTSLFTMYVKDLFNDGYDGYRNILPAVSTKILVGAYLKKAGFANTDRFITAAQMRNILNI